MRKHILYIILVLLGIPAIAQQLPQYTNFTYAYMNYNPAVTGYAKCLEAKVGYRRQWSGFQGAPRTGFANAHGRFGVKQRHFHGIGGMVESDVAGPFNMTSVFFNYAYHLKLSNKYTLSTGIGIGFTQYRLDFGSMILEQQDIDPAITGSVNQFIFPQINFGMWLYRANQFWGLSIRQIKRNPIDGVGTSALKGHLTLAYGRAIKVSDDLMFKPAFLMNYTGRSKGSFEAQGLLAYKEKFSVGMAVRGGNGVSALVKFDVIPYVTLAYAYDLTVSKIRYSGSNTHEIIIGIQACPSKEGNHEPCAAYD